MRRESNIFNEGDNFRIEDWGSKDIFFLKDKGIMANLYQENSEAEIDLHKKEDKLALMWMGRPESKRSKEEQDNIRFERIRKEREQLKIDREKALKQKEVRRRKALKVEAKKWLKYFRDIEEWHKENELIIKKTEYYELRNSNNNL